jgi:hypothetical protein
MRKFLAKAILTAAIAGVPVVGCAQVPPAPVPVAPQPAGAVSSDVPVKEVVLFSSGVGYFQHEGLVRGDGSTELRFKTDQINDILKSLILQDLDGGKASTVTYPSQDPIAKTLRSFQVDITNNPPLSALLNQLRGAKVTLATGSGEAAEGTILGVETHKKSLGDRGETIEQPFLNLLNSGKIQSISMDTLSSIKLDDPDLQEELNKALVALASARDQDKKPVKINFTGQGDRRVRIGYVVETPIWKSSYRLLLGDAKPKSPASTQPTLADGNLQGWAIVENQTDNDWNNVQLSLVSGRPISFVEDLYMPLYIPRPVVEPELYASLRPQTYAEALAYKDEMTKAPGGSPEAPNRPASATLGPLVQEHLQQLRNGEEMNDRAGGIGSRKFLDAAASVGSLATAANVGELFEYTVGNVSLARQRSAMIPIITDPIEVERVSIYNADVLPRNPLNGARVKNTTQKHLLAGPITVIDGGTYAGDAQIDNIPPGQERLLSYGVDLQMLVDATNNRSESQIQTGKIVKGVLFVTRKDLRSQDYIAQNKSDHEKALIIEHPRTAGWDLVDTDKPIEQTDSVYRFKSNVAAGEKSKLTVTEQIIQDEQIAILPTDPGQLDLYRKAGEIPKNVQEALAKAIDLRQTLADTERQIEEAKEKLNDITTEQNRIRENMKTVNQGSQYYTRLITKLNDQETEIEKTQEDVDNLQKKMNDERSELEAYLGNLNVG